MGYIMDLRKLIGSRPIVMTGACVLLLNAEGQLLLQHRKDNGLWGLPGGSLEPGETLEDAAKRELFEETGYSACSLELLHVFSGEEFYYQYPHGDEVYNVVAAYICTDYEGSTVIDGIEVQDVRFFDLNHLPEAMGGPDPLVIDYYMRDRSF
ncbi:NUDIX hydrolase [Fictibacillus sp. WQ 8-8]|uniref:NUDIX hydrolase n=1 Tax=unclassified Fictibacillus TaxID=2644029 RepID=UPI0008F2EBA3|nr:MULTISPECIES: NUDIX hydrolase [unclassified Fictibacillus]MCQ6267521.1 NUDIX hydrolase [Fictibacillus sp. WQ 8-8]MED2975103.1 NUDIX hydrolase [Fictibacillus sp. B-59209]SFE50915.1 ADP-ribose pyrophosphatase YjhB, NUDIX family [Bacillus sp. OV194]